MSTLLTGVSGSYVGTATAPAPGDLVTASSIQIPIQALLDDAAFLNASKVDRAGDTMTGTLTISSVASSALPAVAATGDGNAAGLSGIGGASNGPGVEGFGGATNGKGGVFRGTGTGTGVKGWGSVAGSVGVEALGTGGNFALDVQTGGATFTGASPSATADPGADGALFAANVCRAWGTLTSSGLAGSIQAGYGIASIQGVAAGAGYLEVTFARAFGNTLYAPTVTSGDGLTDPWVDYASTTTTKCRIYCTKPDGSGTLDPTAVSYVFHLHVFGR